MKLKFYLYKSIKLKRVGLFVSLTLILFTNCSSSVPSRDYSIISEFDLPTVLAETSGLFCSKNGSAFTINDSGNESTVYEINGEGAIINMRQLDVENKDWEALTGDESYYYIGDVGNNSGKRESITIHSVPLNRVDGASIPLLISYEANLVYENEYLAHDFDAEALVNLDESLYLFSKSWRTETLFIYKLSKNEKMQNVTHIKQLKGLPGVITGGDYDPINKRFILVGYKLKGIGLFYPFVAILSQELKLIKAFDLDGFGQVEGVCVTPNGQIWFTQERSILSKNKLVKIKVPS